MITPSNINDNISLIEERIAVFLSCNNADKNAIATWHETLVKIQNYIIENQIPLLENDLIPYDLSERVKHIQNRLKELEQPSYPSISNLEVEDIGLAIALRDSLVETEKQKIEEHKSTLTTMENRAEIELPTYEKNERLSSFISTIEGGVNEEINAAFILLPEAEKKELTLALKFPINMLKKFDNIPLEPFTSWRTRQAVYNSDNTIAALQTMILTTGFRTYQDYLSSRQRKLDDMKKVEPSIPSSLPSSSSSVPRLSVNDFNDFQNFSGALVDVEPNDPIAFEHLQFALCQENRLFNFKERLNQNLISSPKLEQALLQTCREYAAEGKKYASSIGDPGLEQLFDECLQRLS